MVAQLRSRLATKQSLTGQAEFGLAFRRFREGRQGDPEEPNASLDRKERFEQRVAELLEFASCPDLHLTGAASGDLPEVGEFDLERGCAALLAISELATRVLSVAADHPHSK